MTCDVCMNMLRSSRIIRRYVDASLEFLESLCGAYLPVRTSNTRGVFVLPKISIECLNHAFVRIELLECASRDWCAGEAAAAAEGRDDLGGEDTDAGGVSHLAIGTTQCMHARMCIYDSLA